jgi:hypothetical protein
VRLDIHEPPKQIVFDVSNHKGGRLYNSTHRNPWWCGNDRRSASTWQMKCGSGRILLPVYVNDVVIANDAHLTDWPQ